MYMTNLFQLVDSIEITFSKRYFAPCLSLIYSGIDIVSSLDRNGRNSKEAFLYWTENYLLKSGEFDCTPLEIYAARCGIIHTFTAYSGLSDKNKARKIIYSWGNADPKKVDFIKNDLGNHDTVVVHIDELKRAFGLGLDSFYGELSQNPEKAKRVAKQAGLWFTHLDKQIVEDYFEVKKNHVK